MARRPSVVSLSSIGSATGLLNPLPLPAISQSTPQDSTPALRANGSAWPPSRSASMSTQYDNVNKKYVNLGLGFEDPDDLFVKHPVAEVRAIQQRLRADADAKQEELRVMVGERYRDLLQASASIISIARSADNVILALRDMQQISSSVAANDSSHTSSQGQSDAQLHALQSLAAHMKLLLDAPEHLWRFMERKLYLHAAWLFLLSRVVQRSLLSAEEEDAVWKQYDIDVSEQFPLVQRQWDSVSQFRSQITHRATLSLREPSSSPPDVCATLLTLHLLESRPLLDLLSIFLAQRTRSLTSVLSRTSDALPNGHAVQRTRKQVVRDLRKKLKAILEILSNTLTTARLVFVGNDDENRAAIMMDVLDHVQADRVPETSPLPPEHRLSSHSLLSTLPSSNHFLLLPSNIKQYKPYVDASSLSSPNFQAQVNQKLDQWLQASMRSVQETLQKWFTELKTIRELWDVRTWARKWLRSARGVQDQERLRLHTVLDTVCRLQALSVWKSALDIVESTFRDRLHGALSSLKEDPELLDAKPVQFLFQPTGPLSTSQTTSSDAFRSYKAGLQTQIRGRTPLLNTVLEVVENCMRQLGDDLDAMDGQDQDTQALAGHLGGQCRSDFNSLFLSLAEILENALDGDPDNDEPTIRKILFVGRIADELVTKPLDSSLNDMGNNPDTLNSFRDRLISIGERTLARWRKYTITCVINSYPPRTCTHPSLSRAGAFSSIPHPSSNLVDSLVSLANSTQQLGIPLNHTGRSSWVVGVLHQFVLELLAFLDKQPAAPKVQGSTQMNWDLDFLRQLTLQWGAQGSETTTLLESRLTELAGGDDSIKGDPNPAIREQLLRMQIMLGSLLPPAPVITTPLTSESVGLLQVGLPSTDAHQQTSALELVKPSARFGLLLVGNTVP